MFARLRLGFTEIRERKKNGTLAQVNVSKGESACTPSFTEIIDKPPEHLRK